MRVLVVDDSTLFRKVVRDVLKTIPGVEVVGVAANGKLALDKIDQLRPDLLTLDIEMPELDGIGVLRHLSKQSSVPGEPAAPGAIMLSSLTEKGAKMTTEALALGAFDFILKPNGDSLAENTKRLYADLRPLVAAFKASRRAPIQQAADSAVASPASPAMLQATVPANTPANNPATVAANFPAPTGRPQVCLIGISTGGPASLAKLLPSLQTDFPIPIIIVQHMPAVFTRKLAESLDENCPLKVQEIEDGMLVQGKNVYIAPGGKQTQIVAGMPHPKFAVTDDPPENHCKPAVDYLFRHAAKVYGGKSMGVILTGMGNDGTEGCRLLRSLGSNVVAQEAASCVVYGMPRSVIEAGLASHICPLDRVAEKMRELAWGQVVCK